MSCVGLSCMGLLASIGEGVPSHLSVRVCSTVKSPGNAVCLVKGVVSTTSASDPYVMTTPPLQILRVFWIPPNSLTEKKEHAQEPQKRRKAVGRPLLGFPKILPERTLAQVKKANASICTKNAERRMRVCQNKLRANQRSLRSLFHLPNALW